MEFIRTIRERHQTKQQEEISLQAEYEITVKDFDDSLYIAYGGTPLLPIEESWTTKEIIQQLKIVRNNYVNSKMKDAGLHRIAAVL